MVLFWVFELNIWVTKGKRDHRHCLWHFVASQPNQAYKWFMYTVPSAGLELCPKVV